MKNNRIRIASLLMAMIIFSMILVPAASAKNNKDKTNDESSGLFGLEMPDDLKDYIIQIDENTFVGVPGSENDDELFEAWEEYEKLAEQELTKSDQVSTSTMSFEESGYDNAMTSFDEGTITGKTFFHGEFSSDWYPYEEDVVFDGYNRGRYFGDGVMDSITLETEVTVSGVAVSSVSVPAGFSLSISEDSVTRSGTLEDTNLAIYPYEDLEFSGSMLVDYDQNDKQTFGMGSLIRGTATHVDLDLVG